jgi:predicted RNase H-like HicB family nuclease
MSAMTTVRVIYHCEPDGWWAESPDIDRWYAVGASYAEVRQLATEGVAFALERDVVLDHHVPSGERLSA